MKPNDESLLENAAKETPDAEAQVVPVRVQSSDASFGVSKPVEGKRSAGYSQDHLKSVRSAREQLDLEPNRQNSHACRVELVAKLMETDVNVGLTTAEAE